MNEGETESMEVSEEGSEIEKEWKKGLKGKFSPDYPIVIYSNVDSFLNKKSEVQAMIEELKPNIIGLTEMRAKNQNEVNESEYSIQGYNLFQNKKPKRGVALFLKQTLNAEECTELNDTDFEESVWVKYIGENEEKILIGCIYRSPNSDQENSNRLFKVLKSDELRKYNKVLIMGDFNFRTVKWDGTWSNTKDNDIIENIRDSLLIQKVTQPTRRREGQTMSVLDWLL